MSALIKDPLLKIRPMSESDVDAVMQVESRAYEFPWTPGIFRDCLRVGYHCWVYSLDQQIIGFSVMSVAVGEAHILNICIAPEHQGHGLGRRLLERTLTLAKKQGADTAFLEVRASNRAALRLYETLGFNEIGLRPGYYPAKAGREDAVLLALSLC
ncbi:MAG: ribosomal-protein-alanine N-acetyltransferase [Sedimenticola sp.]|jgi:ribosomal-protein-alanine N-acetyltransferase|nr:MAG: ribosomal-protein-alanine N-acetyltransferase [Sedimenticola sp.]